MVKYKKIVFFILSLWAGYGSAQYRAANWVINKYYLTILPGGIELDSFPPGGGYLGFLAKASIGDEQGNLLLFSNAIDVRNRNGIVIENGSNLCESIDWPEACIPGVNGSPHIQGALIIPNPGKPNQYYLFIKDMATDIPWEQPMRVTASLIDMSYNTGLGKVLQRAVPILNDTLSDSRMTACKHANGRDWWLINHEYNTNRIYTHLITPDTILGPYSQYTGGGGAEADNGGWSVFSTDGTRFATVTAGMSNNILGSGITLLDFERCSGLFTNYRTITLDTNFYSSFFLAFSPNGRFLYSGSNNYLYQYDIEAADISASGVQLVYDSMPPYLGMMSLMPDNRIYIAGWSGATECFSVIDSPDLKYPDCSFHLRSICLTVPEYSAPNFPNYNLGALAGSGCDTITDIRAEKQETREQPRVFPNPANEQVEIVIPRAGSYEIHLLNTAGQLIERKPTAGNVIIDTENLPAGIYFLKVTDTNHAYYYNAIKLAVQH